MVGKSFTDYKAQQGSGQVQRQTQPHSWKSHTPVLTKKAVTHIEHLLYAWP